MSDVNVKVEVQGTEEGSKKVEGLSKSIANTAPAAQKATTELERLTKQLETAKQRLADAEKNFGAGAKATQQYADNVKRLEGEIKSLSGTQQQASQSTNQLNKSMFDLVGGGRQAMEATKLFSGALDTLKSGAGIAGGLLVTGLGYGATKAAASLMEGFENVRKFGDELYNMSMQTGISAEELSSFRLAAETSGVTMNEMGHAINLFNRNVANLAKGTKDGTDAFSRMGIEVRNADGTLKDSSILLKEVADKFAGYADGANKTALAMELFGRAGANMIPLLNEGASGLAKLQEEAKKAGLVMAGETAKAADELNDNLAILKAYGQGFWEGVASPVVRGLAEITRAMRDARNEGAGFLGSLLEAVRKAAQIAAGYGNIDQEMKNVLSRREDILRNMTRLQQEEDKYQAARARDKEAGKILTPDTSSVQRRAKIAELRQELAKEEAERDRLAGVQGALSKEIGTADTPYSKPQAPDTQAKSKKEKAGKAGKAGKAERDFTAEEMFSYDESEIKGLYELGAVGIQELEAFYDRWYDLAEGNNKLQVEILNKWNREREKVLAEQDKVNEKASKAALDLFKKQEADQLKIEEEGRRQRLQILFEEYDDKERAVRRNTLLSENEKAEELRRLADELEAYKAFQSEKKEVDAEQRKLRKAARDIEAQQEQMYYETLSGAVSTHLLKFMKGQEDLGKAVLGTFSDLLNAILKKLADFFADKFVKWLLEMLGIGDKKENKENKEKQESMMDPIFDGLAKLKDYTMEIFSAMSDGLGAAIETFSKFAGDIVDQIGSLISSAGSMGGGGGGGDGFFSLASLAMSFFPTGTKNRIFTEPTLIAVADAGTPEQVTVSPVGSANWETPSPIDQFPSISLPEFAIGSVVPSLMNEKEPDTQALDASRGAYKFATGTQSAMFSSPTLLSVAEAGTEKVTVSPMGGVGFGSNGSGRTSINFNAPVIMDVYQMKRLISTLDSMRS